MMSLFGSAVVGYLAGAGLVSNGAIVTRGLFKAVRRATEGRFSEAGVEALAALASPTILAVVTSSTMVTDIIGEAYNLVTPALEEAEAATNRRLAA